MSEKFQQDVFTIARLCDDNLTDVCVLHKAVYGKKVTAEFYYRKYNTGFSGKKYMGYIAYNSEKKPVAFNGALPCYLHAGSEIIIMAQCADALTHPQYRLKGLFAKVCEMVCALCKEEGIYLLFGFPNQNSLPPMVTKLGWQQAGHLCNFTIPVKTLPFKHFVSKLPFLNVLYKLFANKIIAKYKLADIGVENSVLQDGFFGVYRDENYLNYKAFNHSIVIGAGKSKAWVSLTNRLMVGDINLQGEIAGVVQVLTTLAAWLGITKIHFITSPNTNLYKILSEKYKPTVAFPVIFKIMGGNIDVERIKFVFADIDIF